MFDPRMMAPDGSTYSRANALAPLAATSGMVTPPGVQTMAGPQPSVFANMGFRDGRAGGRGGWNGGQSPMMMDWRTQMQDWRGLRPQFAPGPQMPLDWRQQMMDWRGQRPDQRSFFQNYQPPGV